MKKLLVVSLVLSLFMGLVSCSKSKITIDTKDSSKKEKPRLGERTTEETVEFVPNTLDASVYQNLVLEKEDKIGFERILDLAKGSYSNKVKLNWKLSFKDAQWQSWLTTEKDAWILDTESKLFHVDTATGKIEYNNASKEWCSILIYDQNLLYMIAKQKDDIYEIQAYQPNTKKILWAKSLEDKTDIFAGRKIVNDILYIGKTSGLLFAIRVKDGSELWRLDAKQDARSDLFFHENLLFFTTADSTCYAVDKNNGKIVWKRQGVFLRKYLYAEFNLLTAIDGVLGYYGNIYEPFALVDIITGKLLWEYPYSSDLVQSFKNNATNGIDWKIMNSKPTMSFISSFEKPFSVENKIVLLFTLGHKKNLHVIDPISKKTIWQKNEIEFCNQTVDNKILIGRYETKDDWGMDVLEKLDPETGKVMWLFDNYPIIPNMDSVDIEESQIIDHYLLILERHGNMFLIDTNDGKLVWSYSSNDERNDFRNISIDNNVFFVQQHSPNALLCFSLVE
jgi:outer membrane protein assembly factor BamB